jgi:hypothetical protein
MICFVPGNGKTALQSDFSGLYISVYQARLFHEKIYPCLSRLLCGSVAAAPGNAAATLGHAAATLSHTAAMLGHAAAIPGHAAATLGHAAAAPGHVSNFPGTPN